jgi:ADP-ribosylglycohydrolase
VSNKERALGAIFGLATGDALGAPHEFRPPLPEDFELTMSGGNGWEPGEWTDDTAMAVAILLAWRDHGEFGSVESLDTLVNYWVEWSNTARDVGIQTRRVLRSLHERTAAAATQVAAELHLETGKTAGNGSLMRTAPLALLRVRGQELTQIVSRVSLLTHFDPDAAEACIIWTHAIAHAIDTGELDLEPGLAQIGPDARRKWEERIEQAKTAPPSSFENNGWVVAALQAALSAVYLGIDSFEVGADAAVKAGYDTDTVAAIAGSLLGAMHGLAAIPSEWLEPLHGWPAFDVEMLKDLGAQTMSSGYQKERKK